MPEDARFTSLARAMERFPDSSEADLSRFALACDHRIDGERGVLHVFERHLAWRRSLAPARAMYEDAWPEIEKAKFYERGRDRSGNRVFWWQTSNNDPKRRDLRIMIQCALYWVLSLEPQLNAAKASGEPSEITVVVDRTHNVLDMPFVRAIVPILQDNFPGRLHQLIVVPAGPLFRFVWAIISPWLNAKTRERIRLLATCEDLRAYIDSDSIPTRMAGTDAWQYEPIRDTPVPVQVDWVGDAQHVHLEHEQITNPMSA